MNTTILLSIGLVLVVICILISVIWAIFPGLGSNLFFILLTFGMLAGLGFFIWYLIAYEDKPKITIPAGGATPPALAPLPLASPLPPASPRASRGRARVPPPPLSPSSSSSRLSSDSSSSSRDSPRSPMRYLSDRHTLATRTAISHLSPGRLGHVRRYDSCDEVSSPLRSVGSAITERVPVYETPRSSLETRDLIIFQEGELVTRVHDLFKLIDSHYRIILGVNVSSPGIFGFILSRFPGLKRLDNDFIKGGIEHNRILSPEFLIMSFIEGLISAKEVIIYIESLESFFAFDEETGNARYITLPLSEITTYYEEKQNFITRLITSPDSIKLYMSKDNKVGLMGHEVKQS